MEITEIRIRLVNNSREKLRGFASVTFDNDLVVRDIKIIEGSEGLFVAMPSRKLADRCPRCGGKNHLRARYCNDCGAKLGERRTSTDGRERVKLHVDVAHPVNAQCRERLQKAIIEAYQRELEQARQPGYKPPAFDDLDGMMDVDDDLGEAPAGQGTERTGHAGAAGQSESGEQADSGEETDRADGSFSEYEELIADLRRGVEERRGRREPQRRESHPPRDSRGHRQGQPPREGHGRREGGPPREGSGPREGHMSREKGPRRRRSRRRHREAAQGQRPLPAAEEARTSPAAVPAAPVATPEPSEPPPAPAPPRRNDDEFGVGLF